MPRFEFRYSEIVPGRGECIGPSPAVIVKAFEGDAEARRQVNIIWLQNYDEYSAVKTLDPESIRLVNEERP